MVNQLLIGVVCKITVSITRPIIDYAQGGITSFVRYPLICLDDVNSSCASGNRNQPLRSSLIAVYIITPVVLSLYLQVLNYQLSFNYLHFPMTPTLHHTLDLIFCKGGLYRVELASSP